MASECDFLVEGLLETGTKLAFLGCMTSASTLRSTKYDVCETDRKQGYQVVKTLDKHTSLTMSTANFSPHPLESSRTSRCDTEIASLRVVSMASAEEGIISFLDLYISSEISCLHVLYTVLVC